MCVCVLQAKLHELEWEVERDALHAALATASGLTSRSAAEGVGALVWTRVCERGCAFAS